MNIFLIAAFISAACADVSHLKHPSKEYLPPFKPDEINGYKYPNPTIPTVLHDSPYPEAYAGSKDIYIPPVRLPLVNEPLVYRPVDPSTYVRPINQSPIVNSANFPPYYQTTSQHLHYPMQSNTFANNYYSNPSGFVGQNSYQTPTYPNKPNTEYIPPSVAPTYSPSAVPDFATPPVAATFPTPTYRPLIFSDPSFGDPSPAPRFHNAAAFGPTQATQQQLSPSLETDPYHRFNNPQY